MKTWFTCKYCGNEWDSSTQSVWLEVFCAKCGDNRIIVRKPGKRVDYYAEDPAPKEERKVSYDFED
jgi:transcription elongation factor Elf1